jgi:hypothetical protein
MPVAVETGAAVETGVEEMVVETGVEEAIGNRFVWR